ncbi:branched-chain amino acid ABC transporter permease [Acuticoccus sp. I52.16.1]|uniref:branched-chain amino acid ABC transporter permease n=1 Tax=Acuticoccus sp. I52.16.1 TaxID=2928472 RepID=UPI001FCFA96E|nr:branched-chain amino acid ABC transporter permease [Acuticoccus sp. I52.16.1]UOM32588.1 branched-chain amino acid ABC transporter permease [Acuticoccus sp. I52.16.1]
MNEVFGRRPFLMLLVFTALLAAVPFLPVNDYIFHVLTLSLIFAVFATGWNITLGILGLKTLGHNAFFAIGAYISAIVAYYGGVSPWLTIWVGAAAAAAAGVLIGFPILRIRSMPHVAIVTLAFAEIVRLIFSNLKSITRGELGFWGIPPFDPIAIGDTTIRFGIGNALGSYGLAAVFFVAVQLALLLFLTSRPGLTFLAIKDSEAAAESLGIRLAWWKLLAFGVSAAVVGLSGAIYAHYVMILTPTSVAGPEMLITLLAIIIVGGVGRFYGPLYGAFLLTIVSELLREFGDFRMLLYGALIIAFVFVAPRGIAGLTMRLPRRRTAPVPDAAEAT